MSVDWFRVNTDLLDHPKLAILTARLGPDACVVLLRVWTWAARLRRDGVFRQGEIDMAAKMPAAQALIDAGFLEADGLTLHDWEHHNGRDLSALPERREKARKRVAEWRAKHSPPPDPPITPTATPTATATPTTYDVRNALRNALHDPPALPASERVVFRRDEELTPMPVNAQKRPATPRKPAEGPFALWYAAYPLKVARGAAEKAFARLDPDPDLVTRMIDAIRKQTDWRAQMVQRNQFVPQWKHPATWINQRCWEDSTDVVVTPSPTRQGYQTSEERARAEAMRALGIVE